MSFSGFLTKTVKITTIIIVIILLTILCAYIGFINRENGTDRPDKKPHIIVIMADDLGWNDVSFHGSNEIPTPNIDALAYNGVILKNHYVLPTCTPSRTAFMTGRYPIRTGMQGFPLRAGEPRGIPLTNKLLPEHLKNAGYATRLVGKWHLGYHKDEYTPARRGFDSFLGYYNGYISYFNHTISEVNKTGYDFHRDDQSQLRPTNFGLKKYATDIFTDEAIDIIDSHNEDQPLYLQIAHLAPHAGAIENPLETRDMTNVNNTFKYIENIKRRKYAGMMSALDESVGRVVSALSKKGLLDNSIVIFMADNGAQTRGMHENYGSNYPFRGLKFTLYEGGVHGVACIYSPLIKNNGRIVENLIHMTDWLPTLYKIAGGKISDLGIIDGVDQWSVIGENHESSPRNSLLLNIDEIPHSEGAVKDQWKLVKNPVGQGDPEYGDYYRNYIDEKYFSDSEEYVQSVLTSPVNQVIKKIKNIEIGKKEILSLRKKNQITCKPLTQKADCLNLCLFNLSEDPCETTDVSSQHPEVVQELEKFIDGYRKNLMNQTLVNVYVQSYPENFNGFWMPFLNNEKV